MGIDLYQTNAQARRISAYTDDLTTVKRILQSYKNTLHQNWDASEMANISAGLDKLIREIDSVSTQLTSLSNKIISSAAQVKREEDLAAAKVAFNRASSEFSAAKQNYIRLQNLYYSNPTDAVERNMNEARRRYYDALSRYNSASAKVKSLS
ncbi:MAG: hypothetical protein IJL87_08855 [Clostridia bacterium]|nr:hypothetical protein [Clostridia bacterium]